MKAIVAIFFIFSVSNSFAENFGKVSHGISLGGWSYHYFSETYKDKDGVSRKYNQSHDLFGWFGDYGDNWTQVGTFTNSYGKRSFFAFKGFKVYRHQHYYTGFTMGGITGYENTEASNSAFIALNGGVNLGKRISIDGMLGWGQANVSFRFNFQ